MSKDTSSQKRKIISAIVLILVLLLVGLILLLSKKNSEDINNPAVEGTTEASAPENQSTEHVHDWVITVTDSTCVDKGYTTHSCSCGESYTDNETDARGHNWLDATCTAPKTCSACGTIEGAPNGHRWQDATCTEPSICKSCGVVDGRPIGHQWDTGIIIKDATEESDGEIKYTCKVCKAIEIRIIPSNEHTHKYEQVVITPPTCTDNGYTTHTCKCGDSKQDGDVAAKGHTWQDATCTAPKTCNTCGAIEGSAKGHSWKDASCTAPKTCNTCGATEGSAKGHSWKDASCTAPKTCNTCGATEGSAKGHSWKDASCSAPKTCTICSATEGSSNEHSWKDATCIDPITCTNCGVTYGEPVGHTWDAGIIIKEATEHSEGSLLRTCSVCGHQETEVIPVIAHTHEFGDWKSDSTSHWKECRCGEKESNAQHRFGDWIVLEEATETTKGCKYRTCSVCEYIETMSIPMKLKIVTQPQSYSDFASSNSGLSFSITCSGGSGYYYYQWQQQVGSSWKNIGQNQQYTLPSRTRGVYTYRCIITDSNGSSVTSNAFTITIFNAPKITVSKNISARVNSTVKISVTITRDSLDPNTYTYMWICQDGYQGQLGSYGGTVVTNGSKYSGATTTTLTIKTSSARTEYYTFRIVGPDFRVNEQNIKVVIQ